MQTESERHTDASWQIRQRPNRNLTVMGASQTPWWCLWKTKIPFYPSLKTLPLNSRPPFQNTRNTQRTTPIFKNLQLLLCSVSWCFFLIEDSRATHPQCNAVWVSLGNLGKAFQWRLTRAWASAVQVHTRWAWLFFPLLQHAGPVCWEAREYYSLVSELDTEIALSVGHTSISGFWHICCLDAGIQTIKHHTD